MSRCVFAENVDIRRTAINVAQELRLYRQSGSIQKQIERANQELALINSPKATGPSSVDRFVK